MEREGERSGKEWKGREREVVRSGKGGREKWEGVEREGERSGKEWNGKGMER